MASTKQIKTPATPGFATEFKDDTDLGMAILVAEFGDGHYEPVAVVVSINEARELADGDMRGRMRRLERGGTPACPEHYIVWAQGMDGDYLQAKTIDI